MYLFDCYYVLHLLVELMSNKKILHLTFWGIAKLSSNISSNISVAEIFYGPTSNVWEFHFLQILVIIYFLIVFIIAILVGGKWYFIVLLICISVLESAEEPEIKLPTPAGSSKKQESSKKHLFLLYWLCQSLWLCGSQ